MSKFKYRFKVTVSVYDGIRNSVLTELQEMLAESQEIAKKEVYEIYKSKTRYENFNYRVNHLELVEVDHDTIEQKGD